MGLSVAVATLALSQSSPAVSFAADSVTVGDLVKALAKQADMRLDVAPAVAMEPVIVQFKDRPWDEVRTRLANLIGATWIDNGGVPTLSRPASLRTDQEREERRRMADWLTRLLDLRRRQFETNGAFDRAQADRLVDRYRLAEMKDDAFMAEQTRISEDNPVVRAGVNLLRSIDPTRLVRMRMGERVVFSDAPTAVQSPFTTKGKEVLTALRKDLAMMEAAKTALGNPRRPSVNVAGNPVLGPARLRDPYGKTNLAVTRYGPLDFRFELTQVAQDGQRLLDGAGAVPLLSWLTPLKSTASGNELDVADEAIALGQLEIRGGGVSMASSQRIEMGGGKFVWASFWVPFEEANQTDPAARIRPKLVDPVRFDPLGIVLGALLRQTATRRKESLLATVGDRELKILARQIANAGIPTEEALLEALTQGFVAERDRVPLAMVKESEGWLEVRPFWPVYTRTSRFDRRAVRDLLSDIRREGALTLPMADRYDRRVRRSGLDYLYLVNGDPSTGPTEVDGVFNASTAFFTALTPPQWNRLRAEPVPVGELSPDQRESVRRWIYEELTFSLRDRVERSSPNPMNIDHFPLHFEPTERYPNGVPNTLRLSIAQTETPMALTQSTQGLRFTMNAASLGLLEGMQANPAKYPKAAGRSLVYYRPARQLAYRLKLLFGPEDELALGMSETRPLAGSQFGPRHALAEAMLKETEAVREAFLKGGR